MGDGDGKSGRERWRLLGTLERPELRTQLGELRPEPAGESQHLSGWDTPTGRPTRRHAGPSLRSSNVVTRLPEKGSRPVYVECLGNREPSAELLSRPSYPKTVKNVSQTPRATFVRGTVGGAIGFLLGYLITWILAGTKAASLTVDGPFGGSVPDWQAVLWVFYDSHFVGIRTPEVFGPDGALWAGGELVHIIDLLGVEYLYAVPAVVLFVAGAVVATLGGTRTPREGAFAGMAVATGYIVVVIFGLFVATRGGVAPSPLRALVIAGAVYPVTFGALGGGFAGLYNRATDDDRGEPAV